MKLKTFLLINGIALLMTITPGQSFLSLSSAEGADKTDIVSVPAYTAYFEPNFTPSGTKLSVDTGITKWSKSEDHIVWYGHLVASGTLTVKVSLNLPAQATSALRLTFGKQDHDATVDDIVKGVTRDATATGKGETPVIVSFGNVTVSGEGMYRFVLSGISKSGATFGDVKELVLSGPASSHAHFSADKSRVAPSVHFWYTTPGKAKITWFYNEVTPMADTIYSFYMACGFSVGYFGMQVNSPTERTILFSVWNASDEKKDPGKVVSENKVLLVSNGDGVNSREFGNEGTGGHSSLVYMWKTGQTYRFLVSAQADGDTTIYTGYFYFPEKKEWGMIASWKRPKDGGYLHGLYSFSEDYIQANGFEKRYVKLGNQWIQTDDGKWTELTEAKFTHTHRTDDRFDRGAGVNDGSFFLTNGGFLPFPGIKYGDKFERPPTGKIPVEILPVPPSAK